MPKDEKSKFDPQKFLDEYEDNLSEYWRQEGAAKGDSPGQHSGRDISRHEVHPLSKREQPVAGEEADEETNRL